MYRISRRSFTLALLASGCGVASTGSPSPSEPLAPLPLPDSDVGLTPPGPAIPPQLSPDPDDDSPVEPEPPPRNARQVAEENARPGTTDWRLRKVARKNEIEGYAQLSTVSPGEAVPVAVSLSQARSYSWVAYRMGHYRGRGGREVARGSGLRGGPQPALPPTSTGLVACDWPAAFSIQTGDDWTPGVYLVKLERDDGLQRYVPFFIRDPRPGAEVVAIIPTTTWAAYNTWGGTSLYDDSLRITGAGRAFQVSFDKPYQRGDGTGHLLSDDIHLILWLEAQGLDVAYVTDEELHRDGSCLASARALVLSGHDEYWTRTLRDRAEKALSEGVSIINLGANNAYWQIRLEPASDGRANRVITCYKDTAPKRDPVGPKSPDLTVKFRDAPLSRPENALFGVMFMSRWHQFSFPMVITAKADHWALKGTGLEPGDTFWQANGYEVDQVVDNSVSPKKLEVLANSPALSLQGSFGCGQMVLRQQGEAWVFSSGGVDFVRLLAADGLSDPRAARLVANVLYRALKKSMPADLPVLGVTARLQAHGPYAESASTVLERLGAPVAMACLPDGGWAVLDGQSASVLRVSPKGETETLLRGLYGPLGLAADASGNIYVSDSDASCLRRITPDGTVSVFAGAPWQGGGVDGPASEARFFQPAGLSLAEDGALWVADLSSGAIRRIDLKLPDCPVSTLKMDLALYRPSVAVAAPSGTVYAVETGASRLISIVDGKVSVVAGSGPGFADGPAESALVMPYLGLALLPDGSLAVADPGNYRIRRITFDAQGKPVRMHTLAGSGEFGEREGSGAKTDLVLPSALALGGDGSLYVAEAGAGRVRRLILGEAVAAAQ